MLRIPRRILRPEPLRHAGRDAVGLQLSTRLVGDVAQAGRRERGARRDADVGGLDRDTGNLDPVQRATGETSPLGRVPRRLLRADVDVHLAGRGVVGAGDHGRLAGSPVRDGVLERVLADRGELVARAVFRMRECPPFGTDLLAVQEQTAVVAKLRRLVVDRGLRREVGRAEAAERDTLRGRVERRCRRVPRGYLLDQVLARVDRQRVLVDRPLRDERADRAVRMQAAAVVRQLMVHVDREVARVVLGHPEPVRDTGHRVAADRVPNREDGLRDHPVLRREHVGRL